MVSSVAAARGNRFAVARPHRALVHVAPGRRAAFAADLDAVGLREGTDALRRLRDVAHAVFPHAAVRRAVLFAGALALV